MAVHWVMDGVDRCQGGFTSQHLVRHGNKFDGAWTQVREVCSVDDTSNHKKQKVYKNFSFAKAVLILEVENTRKDSELETYKERTLSKKQSTTMEGIETKKHCM